MNINYFTAFFFRQRMDSYLALQESLHIVGINFQTPKLFIFVLLNTSDLGSDEPHLLKGLGRGIKSKGLDDQPG